MRDFGPNHLAVVELFDRVGSFAWFSRLEQPLAPTEGLARGLTFPDLVERDAFGFALWNKLLAHHEEPVERLIFDNGLLDAQAEVSAAFKIERLVADQLLDDLLEWADETYAPDGSYFADSYSHPHELVEFPSRLVIGAALEVMVGHLNGRLSFFQELLVWFERGRWPVGWDGAWPEGLVLVW